MIARLLFAVLAFAPWIAFGATCSATKPEPFDSFFQRFANEHAFAVQRTILPLRMLKWEYGVDANGKDESAPDKSFLSKNEYLKWPTLNEHMKSNGLKSDIKKKTRTTAIAEVFLPNSDWLVLWHFKLREGCWFFWQHEDKSL